MSLPTLELNELIVFLQLSFLSRSANFFMIRDLKKSIYLIQMKEKGRSENYKRLTIEPTTF